MRNNHITLYLFVFLSACLTLSGCDLFGDNEHCQYTRDRTGNWNTGYNFGYFAWETEDNSGDYSVINIFLGGAGEMLRIEDVCTGDPVMVSAEIRTKFYDPNFRPYLYVFNKFEKKSFGTRGLRLTPTSINGTVYRTDPVEIPVWPDFSSDEWTGTTILTVGIYKPQIYVEGRDNINWRTENYLRELVSSAKITTSYTYY
jgi:hypothetical protein